MDFQQAQERREAIPVEADDRRPTARKRAEDARLRRAIRDAFAHERKAEPPRPEAERLRVVDPAPDTRGRTR